MRVAVCISGQMRTFKRCASKLRTNLLVPNKADVFINTWRLAGNTNKITLFLPQGFEQKLPFSYWHGLPDVMADEESEFERSFPNLYEELQQISKHDDIIEANELSEIYNTNAVEVEDFSVNLFDDALNLTELKRLFPDATGLNAAPMYYKIYKCDLMRRAHEKKVGIRYDLVIRIRPDLEIFDELKAADVFKKGELATLHNPYYGILGVGEVMSNDMFFVGDSETMSYTSNLWNYLPKYWDPNYRPEVAFCDRGPERILNDHLRSRKLNGSVFELPRQPNRAVASITFDRMTKLLLQDLELRGSLPEFIKDCVSVSQSFEAIRIFNEHGRDAAEKFLADPITLGEQTCTEPYAGRAKIASLTKDETALSEALKMAKIYGQERVFPDLLGGE